MSLFSQGGKSASLSVTVGPAAESSIAFNSGSATSIAKGLTNQYANTVTFTDGTTAAGTSGTWSVTNGSGTGTISTSGLFTTGNQGTVTVVYTQGGKTASLSVTVAAPAVSSVAFDSGSATSVTNGNTQQYAVTDTLSDSTTCAGSAGTWSVTNGTGSGSIDSSGLFTASSVGTVTVGYTEGGQSASLSVTVTAAATLVSLTVTVPALTAPNSVQCEAVVTFSDASTQEVASSVNWVSSDSNIAMMNPGGNLLAMTSGTIVVTGDYTTGGITATGTTEVTIP